MEQEEIVKQYKKHLRTWRLIAWILTLLLVASGGVIGYLYMKQHETPKEPEEVLPDTAFLIKDAETRVASFDGAAYGRTMQVEEFLGWQYISVVYESGMRLCVRNEYPIIRETGLPDTSEKLMSVILTDGTDVRECRNAVTADNIFTIAEQKTVSFGGQEYVFFANDDYTYGLINLNTMQEVLGMQPEEIVKTYFTLTDIGDGHVSVKAGNAEYIYHSDVHEISFECFQTIDEDHLLRIATPVCLGDGEYIGYMDGLIVPSGDRFALIEPKFGAYVGMEYEDPESTKIIEPIAEPIENPIVLSGANSARYYLPRFKNVGQHSYNWDNLVIHENGFRELLDDEGNRISKMGIDVSKYNKEIDWKQVKEAGIEFAIVRVGYRGVSQGSLEEDEWAKANIQRAAAQGIDIGVYFYTQAITEAEAIAEADFVLNKLKEYGTPIQLPIVIDTEEYESSKKARGNLISRAQRTKCLTAFCKRVEEAGYTPMIYASTKWSIMNYDRDELAKYPFWFAFWGEKVAYRFEFAVWQYTDDGHVPGIEGHVDLDIMLCDPVMK